MWAFGTGTSSSLDLRLAEADACNVISLCVESLLHTGMRLVVWPGVVATAARWAVAVVPLFCGQRWPWSYQRGTNSCHRHVPAKALHNCQCQSELLRGRPGGLLAPRCWH